MARAPVGLEEVGQSLGVPSVPSSGGSPSRSIGPGLAAAFCLVFLETATELVATLMLIPTGMKTPGHGVLGPADQLQLRPAAPYAGMMVLIAAVPSYVLGRWFDRLPARAARRRTPALGGRRPASGHNWMMKDLAVGAHANRSATCACSTAWT